MDFDRFMSGEPITRNIISTGTSQQRASAQRNNADPEHKLGRSSTSRKQYASVFAAEFKNEVRQRFIEPRRNERWTMPQTNPDQTKLPIDSMRIDILHKIRQHTVTILSGPTGCGKTTRVPQYIYEDCRANDKRCNIIVAQPRRIAAKSNAKRVCLERKCQLGTIVGYQVGSDQHANCGADTRILFCTTGILVEKLLHQTPRNNPLKQFTHVILDEVHERDKDMDFLMILLYKYLNPDVHLILMSATMDIEKFQVYYDIPLNEVAVVKVKMQCEYTVTKFYLDDLEGQVWSEQDKKKPEITEQMWLCAERLVAFFERLDRKEARKSDMSAIQYTKGPKPTVLIFLPGIYEIKQMYERLERWTQLNKETKIVRICLHSTVEPIMSELAMQPLKSNVRKIILATNMAESSITVPDVKYVIDFCLSKQLVVDEKNVSCLKLAWASKANCVQRAGRTGRVMNGKCFRLVSKRFFEDMDKCSMPELLASPLENIILKTKQMNIGKPEQVLALAMDRPELHQISMTVDRLKEMGALLCTTNGSYVKRDGDITNLGQFLTRLPIDVKLSKLILLGYCFGVLEECIIIAAALNCTRSIYKPNVNKPIASYTKLLEFANGSGSDLFAMLNAYNRWKTHSNAKYFGDMRTKVGQDNEAKWAKSNFLDICALRECNELIKEIRFRVRRMNLVEVNTFDWRDSEKYVVLKVVIAGAFYPNYFSRSTRTRRESIEQEFKTMCGKDPCNTVYFTGFKPDYLPHIYFDRIRHIFTSTQSDNAIVNATDVHKIQVTHAVGTEKIFVTFRKHDKRDDLEQYGVACQPGFVLTEVFKSQLLTSTSIKIPILTDRSEALDYAHDHQLLYKPNENGVAVKEAWEYNEYCFPKKNEKFVAGYIVHTENCGRFWFQPSDVHGVIECIHSELNASNDALDAFRNHAEIKLDQVVAANFPSGDQQDMDFHRAKVISMFVNEKKETVFNVQFIDFGNSRVCRLDELRQMAGLAAQYVERPPCCFECSLANVQPSQFSSPDGVWSERSTELFESKTDGIEVVAEVYSCVNGVVRTNIRANDKNINELLKMSGFAEFCEESVVSKQDHLERNLAQRIGDRVGRASMTLGVVQHLRDEDTPLIKAPGSSQHGLRQVNIKGPMSPLRIQLFGIAPSTARVIQIARNSVNSVLLENEPNDMSEKHLVAVNVCQQDEASKIHLRHTTLLPNVRIFGPMMAAMFAPRMCLRRNATKTQFIKMMTGLGCDNTGAPIASDSDLKFELDAAFGRDDLERINRIRRSLNYLVDEHIFRKRTADIQRTEIEFQCIKNSLISLLSTTRPIIADEFVDIKWTNSEDPVPSDTQRIFPAHKMQQLQQPTPDHLAKLKSASDQMDQDERANVDSVQTHCKLCNKGFEHLAQHLLSRQHRDQVQEMERHRRH